MGVRWEDPDEGRRQDPVSGYWFWVGFIVILVVLVMLTGCSITSSESIPLPTSPSLDSEACLEVDIEEVSALIPNDWDEWCVGFEGMRKADLEQSNAEHADACAGFWNVGDEDILAAFMIDGTRDRSIGAIDYMWTVC